MTLRSHSSKGCFYFGSDLYNFYPGAGRKVLYKSKDIAKDKDVWQQKLRRRFSFAVIYAGTK